MELPHSTFNSASDQEKRLVFEAPAGGEAPEIPSTQKSPETLRAVDSPDAAMKREQNAVNNAAIDARKIEEMSKSGALTLAKIEYDSFGGSHDVQRHEQALQHVNAALQQQGFNYHVSFDQAKGEKGWSIVSLDDAARTAGAAVAVGVKMATTRPSKEAPRINVNQMGLQPSTWRDVLHNPLTRSNGEIRQALSQAFESLNPSQRELVRQMDGSFSQKLGQLSPEVKDKLKTVIGIYQRDPLMRQMCDLVLHDLDAKDIPATLDLLIELSKSPRQGLILFYVADYQVNGSQIDMRAMQEKGISPQEVAQAQRILQNMPGDRKTALLSLIGAINRTAARLGGREAALVARPAAGPISSKPPLPENASQEQRILRTIEDGADRCSNAKNLGDWIIGGTQVVGGIMAYYKGLSNYEQLTKSGKPSEATRTAEANTNQSQKGKDIEAKKKTLGEMTKKKEELAQQIKKMDDAPRPHTEQHDKALAEMRTQEQKMEEDIQKLKKEIAAAQKPEQSPATTRPAESANLSDAQERAEARGVSIIKEAGGRPIFAAGHPGTGPSEWYVREENQTAVFKFSKGKWYWKWAAGNEDFKPLTEKFGDVADSKWRDRFNQLADRIQRAEQGQADVGQQADSLERSEQKGINILKKAGGVPGDAYGEWKVTEDQQSAVFAFAKGKWYWKWSGNNEQLRPLEEKFSDVAGSKWRDRFNQIADELKKRAA